MKEGLRVHPASPQTERVALRDDVIPLHTPIKTPAGELLTSVRVRAGQVFHIPFTTMHLSPAAWGARAAAFDPARWLAADAPQNPAAFLPFSYGPANCVGRHLALREMALVVGALVRRFEFAFADGFAWQAWPGTLRDYLVLSRGPLLVTVRDRQARKH